MDAERAHRVTFSLAKVMQTVGGPPTRWIYQRQSPASLRQELFGLSFRNPISIAAGLDKNAELLRFWRNVGCGFAEVGSASRQPAAGNPKPRAFRIKHAEAIINRMGLNNDGIEAIGARVAAEGSLGIPVGINIAKTHDAGIIGAAGIQDVAEAVALADEVADYVVINISCPNTAEGKTFEEPEQLAALLEALPVLRRPLLVKLSPDRDESQLRETLAVLGEHRIAGLVATNTTTKRPDLQEDPRVKEIGRGGLSGKPLRAMALETVSTLYRLTAGNLPIIGVGGIDSADAAYEMIRAGASLLQLYTGLVYRGPALFKHINRGIAKRLAADGFDHISDAVGAEHNQKAKVARAH